jgi:5-hydroxyisourate hydrolase
VTLSTHVLDASTGHPAADVAVHLERRTPDGSWARVGAYRTDADGRLRFPGQLLRAEYRITFGTGEYFAGREVETFYPEVTVMFEITAPGDHYHVPLLLSPFAYSTYRGS